MFIGFAGDLMNDFVTLLLAMNLGLGIAGLAIIFVCCGISEVKWLFPSSKGTDIGKGGCFAQLPFSQSIALNRQGVKERYPPKEQLAFRRIVEVQLAV